jgi:isoleucyl-tRNA synthetase
MNVTCRNDVLEMGLDVYNQKCREFVMSCQDKWKTVTQKLGRWIDMDDAYKTMDSSFMNSVWYIFSQLYKKELIYHGVKIMSYSPGLECPLSNNEANLNYQNVSDPSLTLQIPVHYHGHIVHVLVWTTTPWTLACNLLLCVHPDLDYVTVLADNNLTYLLLESQVDTYFKSKKGKTKYEITEKVKGSELVGLKYQPLFPFYTDFTPAKPDSKPFHIVADTMVSSDSGTGIVHIAPSFGQEDMNVATKYGLVSNEVTPPCPLDSKCNYVSPVSDMEDVFANKFCKDSDKDVIKYLKNKDLVFRSEYKNHDYPYCYRTDKPLVYLACPAWFLKVNEHKEKLKQNLKKTNWVPTFVRDNKFMEMLDTVPDWCVSRNRFWGTPLPIWTNGEETIVVESARELEQLANLPVNSITDLHPEFIFNITIPSSKSEGKPLENVKLVLDCWFESGSMPFGQWGYPFNPDVKFEDIFPADFIAEGTDQTRGWFNALLTLFTLLGHEPPYKNVIVNGIVQSPQTNDKGKKIGWAKMSKKDGNYSDPETLMDKFGADTLRLFLVKSPGVRGGDVPFDTKTFKIIHKNYYIMIQNMVTFWKQSLDIYNNMYKTPPSMVSLSELNNKMSQVDVWIMQVFNEFLSKMNNDYQNYHLYFLTDYLDNMIDKLSRWYIKLNKKHLKGENSQEEFETSISVLTYVLHYMLVTISPIVPFMSDTFYLYMKQQHDDGHIVDKSDMIYNKDSVHLHIIPQKMELENQNNLLDGMELFIQILELSRYFRSEKNKPLKMPVKHVTIAYDKPDALEQLKHLTQYLKQEVNSMNITFSDNPFEYIDLLYKPNKTIIGKKYKKSAKAIVAHFESSKISSSWFKDEHFAPDASKEYNWRFMTMPDGTEVVVEKEYFDEYVEIKEKHQTQKQFVINHDRLVMVFNMEVTFDMLDTYHLNCLAREIQEMRKEAKLTPLDTIQITYDKNEKIKRMMQIADYQMYLDNLIHQKVHPYDQQMDMKPFFTSERDVGDLKLMINFHR